MPIIGENVMQTIWKEILKKVEGASSIAILRHQHPDPDALGAQMGLKEILYQLYPDKSIKALGNIPEHLTYIAQMDEATQEWFEKALVIVVDTANVPRMDTPYAVEVTKCIKIDHHPDDDSYGDIRYVDPTASSCSEMILQLALELDDEIVITEKMARYLYVGIVGDTGRFLYPATTSRTFSYVARLLEKCPFDHAHVSNGLMTRTSEEIKLMGYMYQHLTYTSNGVAFIFLTTQLLDEMGIKEEQTSALVSLPGTVEGVVAWIIFVEQGDKIRCRIRSKGPIINELAKLHDGGGHPLASGANAYSKEEMDRMIEELDQLVMEWKNEQKNSGSVR